MIGQPDDSLAIQLSALREFNDKIPVYQNAAPYFDLVREALGALVDGKHFFDILTEDAIYEVRARLASRDKGSDPSDDRV